jgi:hypothetical protein
MENIYQIPSNFRSDTERQIFWAKVVADQIASGMGAERFCQQHQINFSKFHYWKYYKIKPDFSHSNSISKPKSKQYDKGAAKFISLQVAADIPSNEHPKDGIVDVQDKKVEILFKNGHKMILPLVISETNLLLLVKIVGGLQC